MVEVEAVKVFLNSNKKALQMVERIIIWDKKLTTKQNAKKLGISYPVANEFRKRFKLETKGKETVREIENPFRA